MGFNDDTSPVNEFRVVFDAYFDADLPLLPDETYLSPDYARMWDFVRVSAPRPLAGAELRLDRSGQRLQRQRAVAQHRVVEASDVEGGAQPRL